MKLFSETRNSLFACIALAASCGGLYAADPMEDISSRPYGGNSGDIASGTRTGGGVYSANIGDDVYIFTDLDANSTPANGHGIYGNATSATTGGDSVKIDVAGPDGDGIRSNPGGMTNAGGSNCTFKFGNDLTVWVRGESSDCVNLNGYSTLEVGNDAKFYAYGTYKQKGEGSHGLRANYASKITTGKNTYIETTGASSHGVYTPAALFIPNAYTASVTLGDGAKIATRNEGSCGVYAGSRDSSVTFLGAADISTEGAGAHGVYTSGSNSLVSLGSSAKIDTAGENSYALYAYNGKIAGDGKFMLGTRTGAAGILARSGAIDLSMNGASVFNGYTDISLGGSVRLGMSEGSAWTLSQSSRLSSIETASMSKIVFTIDDIDDYTFITADSALLDNSVMKIVLGAYNPVLNDEFILLAASQIGGSGVTFDLGQAALDSGLRWDTSSFLEDGAIRVAAVPEPAALGAILAALAAALGIARKKRR